MTIIRDVYIKGCSDGAEGDDIGGVYYWSVFYKGVYYKWSIIELSIIGGAH